MDLTPNAVIAGRYQVEKKVGAGGMGEVWLGQQVGIGVRVAVKTLLPAAATNNEVIARFKREAFLLAQIRSDHVARVIDFVTDEEYGLVLVMEFVEGDPLSRILQEKTLTVEEAIDLGVGIASALKDLHKANIIHRDLKPGNIIMAPTPDGRSRAVVVDFGVSRMMNDKSKDEDEELTGITRADMAVGTIEYMAPEQILNSRNVTPGSDIYAAGAMLFRAAAGRHIFNEAKSDGQLAQQKLTTDATALPLQRADKAAEGLIRVVGKMIKRRPSERYKTADEVLADLVPVRDMARGAVAEMESTTIDGGKGLTVPMPASGIPGVSVTKPSPATAALAAQPAPTPAPAAAAGASVAQPTPTSSPISAPAPMSGDSSVSISAPQLPRAEAPVKKGIPPVVTFGLVAAALAAGIFLGPRVMAPPPPPAPAVVPDRATAAPTATQAPTATAAPAETATAAPSVSATAEAMPTSTAAASASAMPVASAGASAGASASAPAAASATAAPTAVPAATGAAAASGAPKPAIVPGPLPKPPPPKPPAAAPPPAPAKPVPAEPTGI